MSGRPRDVVNVTSAALRQWPLPKAGEDKESRGRVLVVGGNRQTPGAVLLAAEAALRSGAGKLQVATVESLAPHLAVALPEALVLGCPRPPEGTSPRPRVTPSSSWPGGALPSSSDRA